MATKWHLCFLLIKIYCFFLLWWDPLFFRVLCNRIQLPVGTSSTTRTALEIGSLILISKRQHKFLLHYLSYLRTILQDVLPVLTELCHALNIRKELETLVEEGNFCKVELCIAFVLSIRSSSTSLSFSSYISKDNILFYLLLTKFYLIAGISSTFRIFTTSRYTFRAFSCARNEPQCWGKYYFSLVDYCLSVSVCIGVSEWGYKAPRG